MISRRTVVLVVAGLLGAGLSVVAAPSALALGPAAGSYVATGPTRVLDTRTGAYGNRQGAVGPNGRTAVTVTGASGVPADASAVALTITVVSATRGGSITASTDGLGSRPHVTNVQFDAGKRATDLALVRPTNGKIDLWNASDGRVQLVADVLGYYASGTPTLDGTLRPINPTRAVDFGSGVLKSRGTLSPRLHTLAGLPHSAGSVAATVTVVDPARSGSLIAYATNTTRPAAPLLDFTAGHSVSQFGVLPVSDIQQLSLFNTSRGRLHVIVDVVGWFPDGPAAQPQTQQVVAANRIFANDVIPAHTGRTVGVLGRAGVPRTGVSAVLVSVRVSEAKRAGTIVGGPGAGPIVVSFTAGRRETGAAMLAVHTGAISLRNTSGGRLTLEVDVVGYVVADSINPPSAPSVARYASDLTRNVADDTGTINADGVADAGAGATFVLIDLGAQSTHRPLSRSHPGIAITLTSDPVVRLSYPSLVTVLKAYIRGVATGGRHVTLAVGTNNDGDWAAYPAAARGRHFANLLIDPLRAYGTSRNVSVIGADDIEANFSSTEAQAANWEAAYFANTAADLVYNGALNDCPTVFGDSSTCAFGWTQADYGRLTRHVVHGRNRTLVLPQIYFPIQAVQWANLYAHAGPLRFVGSLTQFASDPATYQPAQGWAALTRALQWKVASPGVPRAVDILTP